MATQLETVAGAARPATAWPDWRAYHVFYHSDRDLLLRHMVLPLLADLLRAGAIERFFFVRYGLGGPHVRLRWRVPSAAAGAAAEAGLAEAAARFFGRWPSTSTLSAERIRAGNRKYVGEGACRAQVEAAYPDASWRPFPVEFEVERYGGLERLPASLDAFTLSSSHVLRLLARSAEGSDWARPAGLRALVQLAWGLATDEDEFAAFAGYGPRFMGAAFDACGRAGEAFFAKRREQLVATVCRELAELTAESTESFEPDHLAAMAVGLLDATGGGPAARWDFAASHLHMTANRLGLTNGEEVYLARMLAQAVQALRRERPETWRQFWAARAAFLGRARRRAPRAALAATWAAWRAGGRP